MTEPIIVNNAEASVRKFTNIQEKVADVAVIAFLILKKAEIFVTDCTNAGDGIILSCELVR